MIRATKPTRTCITVHHCSTRDAIKNTYTVVIYGVRIFTTATKSPDVLTEWIDGVTKDKTDLRNVGLEFEFDTRTTRISTVQLFFGNRCLVFQLDKNSGLPAALQRFLCDHEYIFVAIHLGTKMEMLKWQFSFEGKVRGTDLSVYAPFVGDEKLKDLNSMVVLEEVECDWDRLPEKLTVAQVHYACLDAFFNIHILYGGAHNIPY